MDPPAPLHATTEMEELFSKNHRKKLEKKRASKHLKSVHIARLHEIMLSDALRIRDRLQRSSSAVPDDALYSRLPRMSEIELFADIDESSRPGSPGVLFRVPANSSRSDGEGGHDDDRSSPHARCCRIVDRFLRRSHRYNSKYASQELSLLYQLFRLAGGHPHGCDLVVDIGGGNANLSCLISAVLDVPVVCVDFDSKHEEVMGERRLPDCMRRRNAVARVECMIQDYDLPPGYERVLVLGKHCCGPGTDAGIDFVRKHIDRVRGAVFATCCCCKIACGLGVRPIENIRGIGGGDDAALGDGARFFGSLYFSATRIPRQSKVADDEEKIQQSGSLDGNEEPSDRDGVHGLDGCVRVDLDRYNGLTGASAKRLAAAAADGDPGESESDLFRRVLPEVARSTSWRNQVRNARDMHYYDSIPVFPRMIEMAEYFESWVQGFRRRRLSELFGWVQEVLYCSDDSHSKQNRCLVSGRLLGGGGPSSASGGDSGARDGVTGHAAFFELLDKRFQLLGDVLPIDFRPRGLVSRKYEFYPFDS